MNLKALKTLIRIEQVQSFSRASSLENMTLAALSMQMKSLEIELGVRLFDRSFRPPQLTPLGRSVAEQAKGMIEIQNQISKLCVYDNELVGAFQIGFVQSASVRILPTFLRLAKQDESKAQFQCSTGLSEVLTQQVELGQIDAAVVTRTLNTPVTLNIDLVVNEKMAIAIPHTHAHIEPKSLSQHLPFIQFRQSTGIGEIISSLVETSLPSKQEIIILDSIESCIECVKAGLGYTILPLPDIKRYFDKKIYIIEDALSGLGRDLVLITRKDPLQSPLRYGVARLLSKTTC